LPLPFIYHEFCEENYNKSDAAHCQGFWLRDSKANPLATFFSQWLKFKLGFPGVELLSSHKVRMCGSQGARMFGWCGCHQWISGLAPSAASASPAATIRIESGCKMLNCCWL